MKPCSHCGKEIKEESIKCRWCKTFIDTRVERAFLSKQNPHEVISSPSFRFKRLGLIAAVAIPIVCSVIFYGVFVRGHDIAASPLAWKVKAMFGSSTAQHTLAVKYANGEGVSRDLEKAFKWHKKAAEQGNADAQYSLGSMYINGEGCQKNVAIAGEWYHKAAEQGNADAQYELGLMYASGNGVQKDSAKASEWFEKSALQGNAEAMIRWTLGEEILCYIATLDYDKVNSTWRQWNARIQNIHTYIQRTKGLLTLIFDYKISGKSPPALMKFMVRLFDKNGGYLEHFTTREFFYTIDEYSSLGRNTGGRIKSIRLKNSENILQYPVNIRDAAFVDVVEFGMAPDLR